MPHLFRIAVLLLFCSVVRSQQTAIYTEKEKGYRTAIELYNKQKYAAAQKEFDAIAANKAASSEVRMNATYLSSRCALELFNKDAEYRLIQFLKDYPESAYYTEAQYALGKYYYRQKRWKKSIEWLQKVDPG